jgi:dimethylhistidine N-methyltransferase
MRELIRAGLTARQKRLPSALLYDELGSALFEAITLLPEYEVARTDTAMLEAHVGQVLAVLPRPLEVVELGPGHGRKARLVLERLATSQPATRFFAVDVSGAALRGCQRYLEDLLTVEVTLVEATFVAGLRRLPVRRPGHRRLVLFLGSNLSNFDRLEAPSFLLDLRASLEPGDALLLSADLEKAPERLLPAYDDALGVTAAFNRNLLVHLNREWGATFELDAFAHQARWNGGERRIEMHLRATRACTVRVARLGLECHFEAGETLWTESSHRFNVAELRGWGAAAGLALAEAWVHPTWPLAFTLFTAV